MKQSSGFVTRRLLPALTALSDNPYLSAIRAGMVAVVPLTIIGGFFMVLAYFPNTRWKEIVAPYQDLLQVPVTATFGLLGLFVCLSIGYALGQALRQDAIVSAALAAVSFLLLQLQLKEKALNMDGLDSKGLFTAIL